MKRPKSAITLQYNQVTNTWPLKLGGEIRPGQNKIRYERLQKPILQKGIPRGKCILGLTSTYFDIKNLLFVSPKNPQYAGHGALERAIN